MIANRIDIGKRVEGIYIGNLVTGIITDSRVVYGGDIKYTIKLDVPLQRSCLDENLEVVAIRQGRIKKILD